MNDLEFTESVSVKFYLQCIVQRRHG